MLIENLMMLLDKLSKHFLLIESLGFFADILYFKRHSAFLAEKFYFISCIVFKKGVSKTLSRNMRRVSLTPLFLHVSLK